MKRRRRRVRMNLQGVSKGDFVAIADILCTHGASRELVEGFAEYFGRKNARFNTDRFMSAAASCRR